MPCGINAASLLVGADRDSEFGRGQKVGRVMRAVRKDICFVRSPEKANYSRSLVEPLGLASDLNSIHCCRAWEQ